MIFAPAQKGGYRPRNSVKNTRKTPPPLLGDQGDPAEGVAVPGLHGVRGLRQEARRGQHDPLRRV